VLFCQRDLNCLLNVAHQLLLSVLALGLLAFLVLMFL
jgi:hypothetical protein